MTLVGRKSFKDKCIAFNRVPLEIIILICKAIDNSFWIENGFTKYQIFKGKMWVMF